jgi:hypothetical protein
MGFSTSRTQDAMIGYNIGMELNRSFEVYFEAKEKEIHERIGQYEGTNKRIRTLSDLMSALTHEQKNHKKANFSSNAEIRDCIDQIHSINPKIFESGNETNPPDVNARYIFKDEESIKAVLQALDAETKMQTVDANKFLMDLQQHYDELSQMMKMSHDGHKAIIEHINSVIHKQRA